MKIQIISDLHLDLLTDPIPIIEEISKPNSDITIIAGDVSENISFPQYADMLSFYFKNILFVPGNHDFYKSDLLNGIDFLRKSANKFDNFILLYNDTIIIDGVKFVGSTLWFDGSKLAPQAATILNDFSRIIGLPFYINSEHKKAVDFLYNTIDNNSIVITHHMPSEKSIDPQYKSSSTNRAFYDDLDYIIEEKSPKLWIHGHTHCSCDYKINDCRVICNPLGYFATENKDFNYNLILEV